MATRDNWHDPGWHDQGVGPRPERPESTLRVLIADHHPLFRAGLRTTMTEAEGISVVGEVESVDEACAAVASLTPDLDVVVMDLGPREASGLAAIRTITHRDPDTQILVMTMSEADDTLVAAIRAGARGYLRKAAGRTETLTAVRAVAAGGVVFGHHVLGRLSAMLDHVCAAPPHAAFPTLTARERAVLDLIARGYDNRRICRDLVVAEKTIRNHVTNIFAKLGVTDRAQAVVRGRQAGLGQ